MFPDDDIEFESLLLHSRVSDFMSTPPITLLKNATMADAKEIMRTHRISGVPIVDEKGRLIGIVSIENIIIALEKGYINDPIEKHMTKDVVKLFDDADVSTVMGYLAAHKYGRYPVVTRDNVVVGIVTRGDLMFHMYERLGSIYMHNKRRDDILSPSALPPPNRGTTVSTPYFSYVIDTEDLDYAGEGSTLFKKFLQEQNFPAEATRRASISLYEAEVNVMIHAGGKGEIKAYLEGNQVVMVVVDHGPGIEDIDLAIQPGYTTASDEIRELGFGAGMGLANIKKYTDKLVILSTSGIGVKIEMIVIAKKETEP
jgi:CBS domain-containing protein/anti-sigma regulatory factor (Ser/Thr protein kinase)